MYVVCRESGIGDIVISQHDDIMEAVDVMRKSTDYITTMREFDKRLTQEFKQVILNNHDKP